MIGAFEDIGPTVPSRAMLYAQARAAKEILQTVTEITQPGPRLDLERAQKLIAEARAKLGPGSPP